MNWSNYFQSWIVSTESDSLFLIPLNYSDSDVFTFTFRVKDGEICSLLYSGGYDWLGLKLTRNTRGHYILILPEVLITPALLQYIYYQITELDTGPHYLPLEQRLSWSEYVLYVQWKRDIHTLNWMVTVILWLS